MTGFQSGWRWRAALAAIVVAGASVLSTPEPLQANRSCFDAQVYLLGDASANCLDQVCDNSTYCCFHYCTSGG